MSDKTTIQWTDCTFSPWRGCTKISMGCKFCYIFGTPPLRVAGQKSGSQRIRASVATWKQPIRWNDKPMMLTESREQRRMRVFPSLCDWLDDEVDIAWLADFLKLIFDTPNLDWQLLTKRPENFGSRLQAALDNANLRMLGDDKFRLWLHFWQAGKSYPHNVWLGTSVENQEMADLRIPQLLKIPAGIRFLSAEPLLGPIDFSKWLVDTSQYDNRQMGISWYIIGGESGPGARPCNVEWIRGIVMQCKAAGVPLFVKQLGSNPCDPTTSLVYPSMVMRLELQHKKGGDMAEWPEDLRVREFP